MTRFHIDSLDDPRLEPYRELKRTNVTRWREEFIAEGDKLVERLLASGLPIESLLADEHWADAFEPRLPPGVPLLVVAQSDVSRIVGFNFHRGVLACGRRPDSQANLELLAALKGPRTLVVCPEVHDPENLGSIVRSSAALGADGLVLGPACCDVFSRRVLRVSMGAVFLLPIVRSKDLASDLRKLRDGHAFELLAAVLDPAAEPLETARRPERLALVLGSEGHGLDMATRAQCQRFVTIPMRRGADSLNVAVASGILLYQLLALAQPESRLVVRPSRSGENG